MKEIRLQAPATIANFGPGFDIFALALERPYNRFRVRLNDSGEIVVRLTGEDEGIPTVPENNTAGLAAIHFLRRVSSKAGVEVEIVKYMRSASGLGSSAASAAATVYGLNRLFDDPLGDRELIEIAAGAEVASGGTAHADNAAACLWGGFVLVTSYQPLGFIKIPVPEIPLVVGVMRKPEQTTRRLIPSAFPLPEIREQMASCSRLIQALMAHDLKGFGQAINVDHISEPVRSIFIPGYEEFKKKALQAGAYGCNVSGGGSSVFAVTDAARTGEVAMVMEEVFCRRNLDCRVLITRAGNAGVVEVDEL